MRVVIVIAFLSLLLNACEKEAGEGGSASISGKVWVLDYNSEYTEINSRYYGLKEDVYLVFGDEDVYSKSYETSYDGSYRFKYLRKGKYKVFVYSEDTTGKIPGGVFPVIREVEITGKNQNLVLDDLVIVK